MAQHQDLVAAVLDLGRAYMLFSPAVLLGAPTLAQLLHWAIAGVQLREVEPTAAAAAFLSILVAPPSGLVGGPVWATHGVAVQNTVGGQGEGLVRALLRALCDSGPRRLLRQLSACLYALMASPVYGDAALTWLMGGLRAPDLPGAGQLPGTCGGSSSPKICKICF